MLTLFFISAVLAVAGVARLRPKRVPVALPPPGPPPESRSEAVRRVLKHIQRKTVAQLLEGEAAVIVGTVVGENQMEAPMSFTRCIGYHVRFHATESDGFLGRRQLHDEARCGAFAIEDATGVIAVDVTGLELAITTVPAHLMRVAPYPNVPVLVEEGVLQPGMRVLVCGVVATELGATDYRDGKPRMKLQASATFPLVASTDRDLFAEGWRPIAPEELKTRRA